MPLFATCGGAGPLGGERATVTVEGARWLAAVRPWAVRLAARFRVAAQDAEDVAQEALAIASIHWASREPDPSVPEEVARRRWLAHLLFNTAARHRERLSRRRARERPLDEGTHGEARAASPCAVVSARELLARLQRATSAPRWRTFVASELHGVPVTELARREGRPRNSLYRRLQAARADLASALRREDAVAEGPMVIRRAARRRRR